MSDSYPTIQDSLSDMQKEFMGCVEMHLDPPEDLVKSYRVEALYRHDDPESALPGNAVRFTIAVDEAEEDVSERRHSVEFLTLGNNGDEATHVGHIRHSMKRIEASGGRLFWTQSQFMLAAPDFPQTRTAQEQVEREVDTYIQRLKVLDRSRALVPVA